MSSNIKGKKLFWYVSLASFFILLLVNVLLGIQFVINSDFSVILKSPTVNQLNSGHPFTRAIYYMSRFERPKSQRIAIVVPDIFASKDQQSLLLFWASYWLYPKTPILYQTTNDAVQSNEDSILVYSGDGIDELQGYTIKTLPFSSYLATKDSQ